MVKRNDTSGYQRKTARVLALEALNKAKQQQSSKASNFAASRKIPKKIRLDEVKDSMFATTSRQEEGMTSHEGSRSGKAILPSGQQIPDKDILEFVIDILQRRDKKGYFAEPVDGNQVGDYYEIIKQPMDFGTMRVKLHEENYVTLKQFQDDIYLICDNAMRYNSSSTIFYREARAIHALAARIFSTLETHPESIFEEFPKKRRCSQKSTCDTAGSGAKDGNKAKGKRPVNCKISEQKNKTSVNYNNAGWRHTYQPPTSREETYLCSPKQLVLADDGKSRQLGYEESLRRFVKDLGPVAEKVATEKMKLLNQARSQSLLLPSRHETPEHGNYVDNVTTDSNNSLAIHSSDPRQKGKMVDTNYLGRYSSDIPSFVGPLSSMYPSTILREPSSGLSGNMFQPSYNLAQMSQWPSNSLSHMPHQQRYSISQVPNQLSDNFPQTSQQSLNLLGTQNPYLQPLNPYQGIYQYNIGQSQDLDLQLRMMNPKF